MVAVSGDVFFLRKPLEGVTKENKVENPKERRCEISSPGDRPDGPRRSQDMEGLQGHLGEEKKPPALLECSA